MGKLLGLYLYLKARFSEPSTHAAAASLFMTAGINIDAGIWHDIFVVLSVAFGGLGFFISEQKPLTKVD